MKKSLSNKKEVFVLKPTDDDYQFAKSVLAMEMSIIWTSLKGGFCDLDVLIYLYDDNARFIEKLNFDNPMSKDSAFTLLADMDNTKDSKTHEEQVHLDFSRVSSTTSSAIVLIDGGARNFQYASDITIRISRKTVQLDGVSSFSASLDNISSEDFKLFESSCAPRKDYQAVLALVLHKTGFHSDGSVAWSCKAVFDPVMVSRSREKDEVCEKAVVNLVPSLHGYRPRLFPSVQAICAELSSTALPNLKRLFMEDSNGLPISNFTKVIFLQLYEVNSRVASPSEAEYTVAMLHELFGQIDYNGDGYVDWDEFTTFCIYTGLITEVSGSGGSGGLDDSVIEYTDDKNLKDVTNTSFAPLALMRHVPSAKKLFVIPDQSDTIKIMTERLGLYAIINPKKFAEDCTDKVELVKLKVMDVVYIPFKDLTCYSTSDHSIVFCKELQGHSGKKHVTFNVYHRINHTFLHVKLCWGEASKILCSVDVNNTIFGWQVDSTSPLFQVNRHTQKITDFVALDNYGLFATCSIDKRIKLWSQTSQRMKGVLVGHKRGVRFLSHAKNCLLSAGFECEARAWDLDLFEQTLILRGHRHSISACQVMSRDKDGQEEEMRGLTVDESGEFRLWDLFAKKGSDSTYATTLQAFNSKEEGMKVRVNFLAVPYDAEYSNGQYSNVIAGTFSLNHFRPEASVIEFVPPSCMIYSETNCCLLSAAGKNLLKYDIITGTYQTCFSNIGNSEISCLCMDGEYGRRVFVGFTNGYIIMINFATGQMLSTIRAHSKAVSCLCLMKTESGGEDVLYSGSNDSSIRVISETGGDLIIHNTLEHATGDNAAIGNIVALEHVNVIIATSIARCWGIWHKKTLKRAFLLQESDPISGVLVLGGGDRSAGAVADYPSALRELSREIITVAVCVSNSVRIYSLILRNLKTVRGCLTHVLHSQDGLYFSNVAKISFPQISSPNYKKTNSKSHRKDVIVASTDTGRLVLWDIHHSVDESVDEFYETYPDSIDKLKEEFADTVPVAQSAPVMSFVTELGSVQEGHYDSDDSDGMLDSNDGLDDGYGSDCSDHSENSLFSLTSAMGTVKDTIKADQNIASAVDVTSIKLAKTTKLPDIPSCTATLKGIEKFRELRRTQTVNVEESARNSNLSTGSKKLRNLHPFAMWSAHTDSVVSLQVLGDSGCFATLGLDGFHRVWNLHKKCLGMLALPNLTEDMKQQLEKMSVDWQFLKEKIPVKPIHTKFSNQLLEFIAERERNIGKTDAIKGRRRGGVYVHDVNKRSSIMATNENRNNILMSLLRSYRDAPNEGLPLLAANSSSTALQKASLELILKEKMATSSVESLPVIDKKMKSKTSTPPEMKTNLKSVEKRKSSLTGIDKVNKEIADLKNKIDTRLPSRKRAATITGGTSSKQQKRSTKSLRSSSSTNSMKTMFNSEKEWNNPNDFIRNPVHAFSSSSLQEGSKDGLLDIESSRILRILNKDEGRAKAFDRVVPGVMLRNVALSTTFKFPDSEVCHSELSFGHQKEMYKNANHIINSKNKVASMSSNMNARHSLASLRLKQEISKAGPMTQSLSLYSDDISMPTLSLQDPEEIKGPIKEDTASHTSISEQSTLVNELSVETESEKGSEKKNTLDMARLDRLHKKVKDAQTETLPTWEADLKAKKSKLKKSKSQYEANISQHSHVTVSALERKLVSCIKLYHADDSGGDASSHSEKNSLRTRDLIPNYKLSDVNNCLNAFFRVDKNLSGCLDIEEWVEFFLTINEKMSAHAARQLFLHVDKNGDGLLSLRELVPVMFSKATPSQVSLILKHIDSEIAKSKTDSKLEEKAVLKEDMSVLFEAYDVDKINYIRVQLIRDKLMRFQLPVAAQLAFNEKLKGTEDDDMVNIAQFTRIFMTYLSVQPRSDVEEK